MTNTLKIMEVKPCGAMGAVMAHPSSYESRITYHYRKPSQKEIGDRALQELEIARAKDVAAHEENIAALENNKIVAERVHAFMAEIEMPKGHSERDTKSRSRYPKTHFVSAGWTADVARFIKTNDGFESATMTYERLKKQYEEYRDAGAKKAEAEAVEKAREVEKAKAERRANIELAKILIRYDIDSDADWWQVLEKIRYKDQYLDLALAMLSVRLDWSEGQDAVRDALDRFKVNDDRDKEIANCVLDGLRDFDDGRVFRDCTWSYDALFAIVADQQLCADAQLAREKSEH